MQFVTHALNTAVGRVLARSVQAGPRRLCKGVEVTGQMCEWLSAAGYEEVSVAELDDEDILENAAAAMLAKSLAASGIRYDVPVSGRYYLHVAKDGLLRVNGRRLSNLNLINEAITLATLADRHPVRSGDVAATVKIIPLALDRNLLRRAAAAADHGILHLVPYQTRRCGVILTRSPLRKESVIHYSSPEPGLPSQAEPSIYASDVWEHENREDRHFP